MKARYLNIIFVLFSLWSFDLSAQNDNQPPTAPVLTLVSVQPETGYTDLHWTPGGSPDVAGYVLYSYNNGEGYAFDTIWDPSATTYTSTGSASAYYTVSYVIAAIDSSYNVSPLSNGINTIFAVSGIDTCRKIIEVSWNNYPDFPNQVSGYKILSSINGNAFFEIASTEHTVNSYSFTNFETDSHYCFVVKAEIGETFTSSSNKTFIDTRMQRPPLWINADYATVVDDKKISLSFSYDTLSGIDNFILERKKGLNGNFTSISNISSHSNPIFYTDEVDNINQIYYYRLSAINNCNSPVISSNISGNITPFLEVVGNDIVLKWNQYREWNGNIMTYKVYYDINGTFEELANIPATDTAFFIKYSDLMYNISEKQVCFYIKAFESANPYVTDEESKSSAVCSDVMEIINVPNTFTPDNDLINDSFKPILSFTPKDYHLFIRDRYGYIVFETRNHLLEWDGYKNGRLLPADVYLWFLIVTAPSGKTYSKTGTITIINK
jgi:gliding motility-associated-like protein